MHTVPTSQFCELQGIRVHYTDSGSGDTTLVLLHGSFLSLYSWRYVVQPLSETYRVVTFDRVTFGQTDRPRVQPGADINPYTPEAQTDLVIALLDTLHINKAILVGNSTGGTISLLTTLRYPTRVSALVMVSGMVYSGYPVSEMPTTMRDKFPKSIGAFVVKQVFGRLYNRLIRSFWHDPSRLQPEELAHYRTLLTMDGWHRAVWELICATHHLRLVEKLSIVRLPTLVISGDSDRTVPTKESVRLAQELPNASLFFVPNCGHVPQEESPHQFLLGLQRFLDKL